jgi:hypothetical protein
MKPGLFTKIINVPYPDCGELSPEPIERIVAIRRKAELTGKAIKI